MKLLPHSLALRPRLVAALAAGILLALLLPGNWRWATRLLVAWDAGAVLYLGLLATTMFTETVEQIRARAERQDEGAFAILVIACLATGASLVAIVLQLTGIGSVPAPDRGLHLALGGVTILCSWTLLHAFFTLHYAGVYYRGGGSRTAGAGLVYERYLDCDDQIYHSCNVVYPEFFAGNRDSQDSLYRTRNGIYSPGCGLDNVHFSWGHDEYLYHVVKDYLPEEASYMIRYHSCYVIHQQREYEHLMSERDQKMFDWVRNFSRYDLYSKSPERPDVATLKPFYQDLIAEFFPPKLHW